MFKSILNFLFPTSCLSCGTGHNIVCESCFRQIPKFVNLENNILSIYSYRNKLVDDLLWNLKYHHSGDVAAVFGKPLAEEFIKNIQVDFSQVQNIFLVPIPLTTKDKRIHNHAEIIAEEVKKSILRICPATNLNISLLPTLLQKNTKIKQAHTKSRQERFKNIKGKFSINSKVQTPTLAINQKDEVVRNKNIYILVDDVTTTGATINEARKILSEYLKISEKEILALTIAH